MDLTELERGTDEIIPAEEFRVRVRQVHQEGRRLRVKAGFDPTAKDLHLGHTLLLNKLRAFQEKGHEALYLIGDSTGMFGDLTGRNATCKPLTRKQDEETTKTYRYEVRIESAPVETPVTNWHLLSRL